MAEQLSQDQIYVLKDNQRFLENNDLDSFYGVMAECVNHGQGLYTDDVILEVDDIYAISKFLDNNGVIFEDYLDEIPEFFCCAPRRWLNNQTGTLWIPENMKRIGYGGFMGVPGIKTILAPSIVRIANYAFEDSDVETLILGKELRHIETWWISFADIKEIKIHTGCSPAVFDEIKEECEQRKIKFTPYNN